MNLVEKTSGAQSTAFQIRRVNPPPSSSNNGYFDIDSLYNLGPLQMIPISQYSCITRSGQTTDEGSFYKSAARVHYYFPSINAPAALAPGSNFLICHDTQTYGENDSTAYPRLELNPHIFTFWSYNDIRFFDQNQNSKLDINDILETNTKTILLHKVDGQFSDYAIIHNTLQKDPTNSEKEAVEHIYRQLRNAEPPDEETARGIIEKLFFSDTRYNLGEVGRYRINKKLNITDGRKDLVLTKDDITLIVKHLIKLVNSKTEVDDIDHLSNRRIRTVGEQLANPFGVVTLVISAKLNGNSRISPPRSTEKVSET